MKNKSDLILILAIVISVSIIVLFNYLIDPYFLFDNKLVVGLNDNKIHMYTNKRQIIFSDMKLNKKYKKAAIIGNCALYRDKETPHYIAFYTVPVTDLDEIKNIVKHISIINPKIKKLYLGTNFNEIFQKDRQTDEFADSNETKLTIQDLTNLFFSWNTTKYSIETIKASREANGKSELYVYPYREIAHKTYTSGIVPDFMQKIQELKKLADENNIELVVYFSPCNTTYKVNIYEKNLWDLYRKFKSELAQNIEFYDYSLDNAYNTEPLDGTGKYYIDNIHTTKAMNNIVIADLTSDNPSIAVKVDKNNVNEILNNETNYLTEFVKNNPELTDKIKNVKLEDAQIKIKRQI